MDRELYKNSVKLILENQSVWGSYIASPAFPTYQYCWLRDGSFIAHAMDTAGEFESAAAFFCWVGRTIQKFSYKVEVARLHLQENLPIGKDDLLHTRYTLDGEEVTVDSTWGNFQIDGYGTWMWALGEHVKMSGDTSILSELSVSIETTLKYLELVWKLPNYDCWEEHPEYLHPYSLATVYAGFHTIADLVREGKIKQGSVPADDLAAQVKAFILTSGVKDGKLVKLFEPAGMPANSRLNGNSSVDSSLIGISIPYQVLEPEDPIVVATMQAIESDLHRPDGGVYRYKSDVYYGGGEWILLTAWLGWYYTSIKKYDMAKELCKWIEAQADENGFLAEQVSEHVLDTKFIDPWVKKWGPIAKPLTWSHAMYIILTNAIMEGNS
jgi:GH15 family glucan-1,4-alpha-glucosidase